MEMWAKHNRRCLWVLSRWNDRTKSPLPSQGHAPCTYPLPVKKVDESPHYRAGKAKALTQPCTSHLDHTGLRGSYCAPIIEFWSSRGRRGRRRACWHPCVRKEKFQTVPCACTPSFTLILALIGFFRVFNEFLFALLSIVAQSVTRERLESFSGGSLVRERNDLLGL